MQCLKNAEVTPVFVADESSNLTKSGEDARRQAKADTALLEPRAHRSLPVPTGDAAYHTKLSKLTVAAAKRITEDLMADVMRYVVSEGGCGCMPQGKPSTSSCLWSSKGLQLGQSRQTRTRSLCNHRWQSTT